MDIERLRECSYLAQTLNFTSTARHFYITQSALSKRITKVEGELGFKLFYRGKNGVHVTKAGQEFIKGAAAILERYDATLDVCHDIESGKEGPIYLGYLYGASYMFLPKAIREFKEGHPNTPVYCRAFEMDEIERAFNEHRINVAITSNIDGFDEDRFDQVALYPDSFCAIVPKEHKLAGCKSLKVEDFVGEDVVLPKFSYMPHATSRIHSMLSPILKSVSPKNVIFDLNSIKMSLMIDRNVVIEFSHLRRFFEEDGLAFIPLETGGPDFDVVVVWERAEETRQIRDFSDILKARSEYLC